MQIQNSDVVKQNLPILAEVADEVGDNQVRNMGTIGGVIAHADAAGDYPTLALILEAEIVTNKRRHAAKDFFKDIFTTPLEHDELVCEVVFPVANGPHKYIKFRRRLFDWAIVGAAAQQVNGGWRIGLTNVGPTPVRATAVEQALASGASPADAAEHASDGLNPSADLRARRRLQEAPGAGADAPRSSSRPRPDLAKHRGRPESDRPTCPPIGRIPEPAQRRRSRLPRR